MCHCAALVLGCVVLAAAQAGWYPTGPECEFIALAIQFCYLAAFFWLSILSYDISQAFREYSKPSQSTSERTFRKYVFIAWGIPFLVTCTTFIIVRFQRADQLPNWIVPPNIGKHDCWFGDSAAKWMYFNGLLVVLMVINTVLYIMTTARLCGFMRNKKELMRGESCMHGTSSRLGADKLRFWLHSRLFLVMGVLWGFDAISPAFEGTLLEDDADHFYWFAVDVVNLLRGFALFCIYCCKRKVVHKLRERAASCGLEWAAPPSHGEGDAHGARWPQRWSAWLSSAGAAGSRRRPSTLSLFWPRTASSSSSAAAPAPAGRARLSTQSTCVSPLSRSPTAHAHAASPAITPIREDPFAEILQVEMEGGDDHDGDEPRRWSYGSRWRLASNGAQKK
ncbi:Probable G-protein coupled receptor Mth-like 11 [Gryllus bimaculatus]|nr:Probable G-protein coupled receptor Mth-like 11 [Gryllus bimaculatus]